MPTVLLLLPHFLLGLALLDEHYAMWLIFFSIVPMLDTVFFVEVPSAGWLRTNAWARLCAWSWLPLLLYAACGGLSATWQSMISTGIAYNASLCLADELHAAGHERLPGFLCDFLGLFCFDSHLSVATALASWCLMWHRQRLLWHAGAVGLGFLLKEHVDRVDEDAALHGDGDHYGLCHYALFRFFHGNLLPASYMWCPFFCSQTGLKDCRTEEKDGLRFDGVPEGPPGGVKGGEAADAPAARGGGGA